MVIVVVLVAAVVHVMSIDHSMSQPINTNNVQLESVIGEAVKTQFEQVMARIELMQEQLAGRGPSGKVQTYAVVGGDVNKDAKKIVKQRQRNKLSPAEKLVRSRKVRPKIKTKAKPVNKKKRQQMKVEVKKQQGASIEEIKQRLKDDAILQFIAATNLGVQQMKKPIKIKKENKVKRKQVSSSSSSNSDSDSDSEKENRPPLRCHNCTKGCQRMAMGGGRGSGSSTYCYYCRPRCKNCGSARFAVKGSLYCTKCLNRHTLVETQALITEVTY